MTSPRHHRVAFLLAQLGSDAASGFEQMLRPLGITPSDAGVLRFVGRSPGISQRAVSEHVGVGSSRIVAVLDRLESRGLVERRRSRADRRSHELNLTDLGRELLAEVGHLARQHEQDYTATLEPDEVEQLQNVLGRIASARGLSVDIHRDSSEN